VTRGNASPDCQLGGPELRMLRAVMRRSTRDAWQRKEDGAAFRAYGIETRRMEAASVGVALVMRTLRAPGDTKVLYRLLIAVALQPVPGSLFDIGSTGVRFSASRQGESPVGCVSPIDARNASPETGQIS
jgi:hypothetical protein